MEAGKKYRFGIRADGNATLGMGHLMRCMTIAGALQAEGAECVFITAEEGAGAFVRERGFSCMVLGTDYRDMDSELVLLKEQMDSFDLLLADSYQLTQKYLDAWRSVCPVFYLDDMGVSCLQADGIINYNIYGKSLGYEDWCEPETALLLGAVYAPVKEEFSKSCRETGVQVSRILITMGGSDALNIAGRLAKQLLSVLPEYVELELICGRFNPHLEALRKLQRADSRIQIAVDVQDMWAHMAEADIAVSAAGSTLYELSTVGVPTVCCYYVENQRRIAEGFAEQIGMVNAGDFSAEPDAVLDRLTEAVQKLTADGQARKALAGRMKTLTDGLGAVHIAKALIQSSERIKNKQSI